jgi:ribonuclease HI
MHGYRWSIGSGTNIRVMSDPWLRGNDGAWIPSPHVQGVHNLFVNDLMVPNMRVWDKGKIESIFPMHIACCILKIPLFGTLDDDKLVWVDNSNGLYSVKSGYKIMLNITGLVHDQVNQQEGWKDLWNIRTPPKAKNLLWRISRGCLPTRLRLQDKRVNCPLSSPLCNQENEDDWHVFFTCETSMQAWQSAGLNYVVQPRLQHIPTVRDIIFSICSTADKNTVGRVAVLLSVLWENRNNKGWEDICESGISLGMKACDLWESWNSVQQVQQGITTSEQQQHNLRWEKPLPGWYKCNVDAAFHQELNKTSTGWCLRDHLGRFIMAETTWIDGSCSIIEGESIALLEALKGMRQRGFSQVIFETDSKCVVDAIHHFRSGRSEFNFLVSNIINILSCNQNFVVKFVKRQANMVAHTLARAAISWSRRCTFELLPLCITPLLNNEMI